MPDLSDDATRERRRLGRLFDATITQEQRQLFAIGRGSDIVWTAEQREILQKLQPYLEGLTLEEQQKLGAMDVVQDGYEAGQAAGQKLGTLISVLVIGVMLVVFLLLTSR